MEAETSDGPPRALLIAAIVVAAGAIIAILVVAALRQSRPGQQTVAIAAVPAPKADSAECRTLLDALPQQLGDYRRVAAADPAPPGAAAWTIRRCWPPWSTRRSSAAPACVRHPAIQGNILLGH